MAASKVYFTTFHTTLEENIQQKLSRLLLTAGMDQIDFKNRYVAIKMHFGEPGNLAYLRPNYAKTVADLVRQLGGKPFLTATRSMSAAARTRSTTSSPPMSTASRPTQRAATSSLPTA